MASVGHCLTFLGRVLVIMGTLRGQLEKLRGNQRSLSKKKSHDFEHLLVFFWSIQDTFGSHFVSFFIFPNIWDPCGGGAQDSSQM